MRFLGSDKRPYFSIIASDFRGELDELLIVGDAFSVLFNIGLCLLFFLIVFGAIKVTVLLLLDIIVEASCRSFMFLNGIFGICKSRDFALLILFHRKRSKFTFVYVEW